MDVQFEQRVNIKFCVKPGKPATETLQILRDATAIKFYLGLKKKAKRTEYRGYSNGCDDGAHRRAEAGIHQLISGLAETLTTVY
jgi:hypothetical protein